MTSCTQFSAHVAAALLATVGLFDISCSHASAEDWPQFRGPTGQGLSGEKNVPKTWSPTDNVDWSTELSGQGWSSPIVVGKSVILTATDESGVSCTITSYNTDDGKKQWDCVVQQKVDHKEARNSYATPTPASDGKSIFAMFGSGIIVAVDLNGSILWKRDDYSFYSQHGLGASPIVWQDKLIFSRDGSDPTDKALGWQKPWNEGHVVALDVRTGKELWMHKRAASRIAHTTPSVFIREGNSPAVISAAGDIVEAIAPENGELIFAYRNKGEGLVPSVVTGDGFAYLASGWGGAESIKSIPLKLEGENDESVAAWTQSKSMPHIPSMLYSNQRLYSVTENGIAMCLDATSGKIVWQKRFPGSFSASPVSADGRLYFLNDEGTTTVIEAGDKLNIVAQNELKDPCQASMAIANGAIFIRSVSRLYCIRNASK